MKLLYLALSFFTLIVLDFYLKSNISGIDRGSLNLPFLGLFVVFGSVLFLWRASTGQSILIRRSTLFLLLFFTYFIFRIVVDIEEMERLKAYTFGSTGGVVILLERLLPLSLDNMKKTHTKLKTTIITSLCFSLVT